MQQKTSYGKNYFTISIATLLAVVFISSIFIFYINHQRKKDNYKILQTESVNIGKIISDAFSYHYNVSRLLGKKIVESGAQDLNEILSILSETNKFNNNDNLMSWTSFSWADKNTYRQIVSSKFGIRKNLPSMADRDYIKNKTAITNPWTIQISRPVLGATSQAWIIPSAMGVTDNSGDLSGFITAGFRISEFENKIQQKLSNSNVNFVVIDNNANIVLQSSGNITRHDDDFYKNNNVLEKLTERSGKINGGIKVYDINYSHYQKIDDYPYIILTGFNQSFLDKEFNNLVIPRILEIVVIAIALLLILLNIEESLKKQLYDKNERLNFLTKSINHDLRNYISGIIGLAQEMINKPSDDKNKEYIKMIASQAENMLEFSNTLITDEGINRNLDAASSSGKLKIDSIQSIDLAEFINELITLKKQFINENKVKIKTKIERKLPKLVTNYFELRKILDNIITNAIKYSKKNGEILIKVEYQKDEKLYENHFYIEITDHGIGMTQDEIANALVGNGQLIDKSDLDKKVDSHGIGLQIVGQSVKNLDAKMVIESSKGKGTTFKFWFKE